MSMEAYQSRYCPIDFQTEPSLVVRWRSTLLASGAVYQPTRVIREIELFGSSVSPARVETDVGEGFIKGLGNPLGEAPLIAELVSAELATWLGLQVPPFAVVRQCEIDIRMKRNGEIMQPPMFCSFAVDGTPRDGGDTFLSRLGNPADVARLVVFDTWVRNNDRFALGLANSDNLLYVRRGRGRKYDLVPIDHSHCFVEADFPTQAAPDNWVTDVVVYGKFPEFDPYITQHAVMLALGDLAKLERSFVEEVVNSVPAEWGLGPNARNSLINLICDRANFVVNNLAQRLVDDPELPFDGV